MEGPQQRHSEPVRDINDLLLNGFYKTSKARTSSTSIPSTSATASNNTPSFLNILEREPTRHRSRSRSWGSRRPPPPKPTCEDEVVALAREFSSTGISSSDNEPPMRGIIEQYPVILEADVTAVEAARLHAEPRKEEDNDNGERRFVLIPRSDTDSPNKEDGFEKTKDSRDARKEAVRNTRGKHDRERREDKRASAPLEPADRPRQRQDPERREEQRSYVPVQPAERPRPNPELVKEDKKPSIPTPPLERRRSRQDLPALKTKEIPPHFRRSASAYAATSTDCDLPKAAPKATRTPSEYMLSPDVASGRGPKGYFDPSAAPRYYPSSLNESSGVWPVTNGEKRNSTGSYSGASGPPLESEKRGSASFETSPRSRRNTNEKLTRPQQLSEEYGTRRHHRTRSTHSEHPRSPQSSGQHSPRHYYTSSDDELVDSSDSDKRRRRHRHSQYKHGLRPEDDYNRHRRSASSSRKSTLDSTKMQSRYTSPLPSPNVSPSQILRGDEPQRGDTFPTHENRRLSSRPVSPNTPLSPSEDTPRASERPNPLEPVRPTKSRQPSSSTVKSQSAAASQASLPIQIPSRIDLHSPGNTERSPAIPLYEEPRSSSVRNPPEGKSYWQPPSFQPPTNLLTSEKPVGSYRRYSEDIERGSVTPLPTCPRTSFTQGYNDWLTLPQLEGFDICPSCYNSTMAKTEFRNHFIPGPLRSADTESICDFGSSPWYRIAWLLTLKERRRDLNLFYGLTNIARSIQPCLGKHEAIRQWHSIVDPRTGAPIRNFDVCTSCVKSVETLLPAIRGVFVRIDSHPAGPPRVCDLRFDSKRFIKYFDALEITANTADELGDPPDTREIAELAKRMSLIEECQHDTDLADRRWYIITQLPEFTVCDECYDEVIYPLDHEKRKAIPAMFTKSSQRIPRASCQLYSARMRDVFAKAVDAEDYRYLASKARERKTVEAAYKANVVDLKRRMVGILGGTDAAVARELSRITEEWRKWE